MKRIISAIADSPEGCIHFTGFILAGCTKKNLLSADNIVKEFNYLDMDHDGMIGFEDMRKFLLSYSSYFEEGEIQAMLKEITNLSANKNEPDMGSRSITFDAFEKLMNLVNDSIRKEDLWKLRYLEVRNQKSNHKKYQQQQKVHFIVTCLLT